MNLIVSSAKNSRKGSSSKLDGSLSFISGSQSYNPNEILTKNLHESFSSIQSGASKVQEKPRLAIAAEPSQKKPFNTGRFNPLEMRKIEKLAAGYIRRAWVRYQARKKQKASAPTEIQNLTDAKKIGENASEASIHSRTKDNKPEVMIGAFAS